jgi:hypothetical protein
MVSRLRTLQAEWNTLVPAAQARGIPRVRLLNAPLETIAYRETKLTWLKAQLQTTTASINVMPFGVELECLMPLNHTRETLAALVRQAGVECQAQMYNHNVTTGWKIVTDGSVDRGSARGIEFVSPILVGDNGFEQLRKVCQVLTTSGCKITKTCGLHVHVDAREDNVEFFKNLVRLYASSEQVIDTFMAPSRRGTANSYCQPVRIDRDKMDRARTIDDVAHASEQAAGRPTYRNTTRYRKLNLQPYWQHGTVEFRQHQGTVEAVKAENWVRFCLRMVMAARAGRVVGSTMELLMATVEATETEKNYFTGRATFFQRRA